MDDIAGAHAAGVASLLLLVRTPNMPQANADSLMLAGTCYNCSAEPGPVR
jgi:hypothetical protein